MIKMGKRELQVMNEIVNGGNGRMSTFDILRTTAATEVGHKGEMRVAAKEYIICGCHKGSSWKNCINQCLQRLLKRGYLERLEIGTYRVTESGVLAFYLDYNEFVYRRDTQELNVIASKEVIDLSEYRKLHENSLVDNIRTRKSTIRDKHLDVFIRCHSGIVYYVMMEENQYVYGY